MNIDHLRYFLVLTQEMHYGRAAQRLNISQSGLSHAMAALEQELGAPLFQKSGRGIALGRYGAALLPQAQQIVTLADNCLRSFQMLREGIGTLRIQTIPLLLVPLVTRLCRQFKAAHPGCDFTFSTGMSSQVCQSVLEGEADLGFCSKIFSDPQLEYAAIQSRPMVAAVPLDHPLAQQESVTPGPAAPTGYVWPVEGEVDRDFSLEVFAYDDTMGDWRTHDGIDIAAELGTPVAACAKGTVSAVTTDDLMGTTVTIDHGKGMESVYANLSPSLNVQAGTEVDAGTVLGTVGTSAIAESASPSHLHFALREYGVTIDPGHYLH